MNYKQPLSNYITAVILFLTISVGASAQQTVQKFIRETQYLLSLPEGYATDTAQKWPLMVFLHGSGERGTDIEKVKAHGPPKLIAGGKKFPFIVVSPQASPSIGWEPENLYQLINSIKQGYRVDYDRIYLTGLSMGGYGTWALAMKYPGEFAAIAPICGGGDTSQAWKLRHIPVWCFHGALDDVVPLEGVKQMVNSANRYNPDVKFTLYPDANHNSWDKTYSNDSLYQWLLAQKKFKYKQVDILPAQLDIYKGKYVNSKDTIEMVIENNALVAKLSRKTYQLKPAGGHLFFIKEDLPIDIRFLQAANGTVDSFIVFEEKKAVFRKL